MSLMNDEILVALISDIGDCYFIGIGMNKGEWQNGVDFELVAIIYEVLRNKSNKVSELAWKKFYADWKDEGKVDKEFRHIITSIIKKYKRVKNIDDDVCMEKIINQWNSKT